MMSNGNGGIALEVQRTECEAAITDLKASCVQVRNSMPGNKCPEPQFPYALSEWVDASARGQIALLRCKVAELGATQAYRLEVRTTRRGIVRGLLDRAVQVALILLGVGFFTVAVQAKSIVHLVVDLLK